MVDLPGSTFSPNLQQRFRGALNGQQSQLPQNTSQALQVLSLHLPSIVGGAPIAPDALLKGGGQMRPDQAVRTMTTGAPSPAPAPPASSPAPSPSPVAPGAAPSLANLVGSAFTPPPTPQPPTPQPAPIPQPPTPTPQPTPTPTQPTPTPLPGFIFRGAQGGNSGPTLGGLMDSLFGGGRQQI